MALRGIDDDLGGSAAASFDRMVGEGAATAALGAGLGDRFLNLPAARCLVDHIH